MRFLALVVAMVFATAPVSASDDVDTRLDVVPDSTQHWIGTNDVLMSVYDSSGESLAASSQPLLVELT